MLKTLLRTIVPFLLFHTAIAQNTNPNVILEKYIHAIGGKQAVSNIDTYQCTAETFIDSSKIVAISKYKYPNQKAMLLYKDDVLFSRKFFNGKEGFAISKNTKKTLAPEEIFSKLKEIRLFPELQLINEAVYTGDFTINNVDCYALQMGNTTNYYDKLTGFKRRIITLIPKNDSFYTYTKDILQYKEVNGVWFPDEYTITIEQFTQHYKVINHQTNSGVNNKDFE